MAKVLFLGTSCVSEPQLPKQPRQFSLHTFSKSSVLVEIVLHISADGVATLVGTYAPEEPSLHLYSLDLPMEGIDGVGRPTRLEIVSGALNTQGALVADVTAVNHTFPQFDAPFPLYPDGAVMLT
ncbi:MAG: hypothetical protein GY943_18030, partial [Chloroflexi bacterium]|nr:hypothetical protein [Chloroflexota bacterium]